LNSIAGDEYTSLSKIKKMTYKSNVFDLVDKARYNLKQTEKEIKKLAVKKYGLNLISNEAMVVSEILKWGVENLDEVDYQDMLFLPYELGYFTKRYLADYVFLDEAQDASLAQQNVISRCFKRNTRFIYFGDKDQSINNWCGSDTEAFQHLEDRDTFGREAKQFPLTTNYRCGKNIIEYAKAYTDNDIHARDGAPDGEVNTNVRLSSVKDGDMVLCRNIAPLMDVYRWGVSNGKKMYFRGAELGRILRNEIDSVGGDTINEIITNMKQKLIAVWNYQTEKMGVDEQESMFYPQVVSILDTIKTMESLPKTVNTKSSLDGFIKDIFLDEESNGIQLSTIHRAKGLEADNVYIICPSLIPSAMAKLPWQIEEEKHLLYVMSTRPKNSLNFVSESDVKPYNALLNGKMLYKELTEIKAQVKENEA
jgi:superfamily I DNA/RNA helicase